MPRGNAFGWTADENASFAVLDAYAEAGGNFIDTADMYSCWVPGSSGGESEKIIGRWLKARGNRDRMVIATKVGALPGLDNLASETIRRTPLRETLAAYVAVQQEYNLVQRARYEQRLAPTVADAGLSCLPYVALARGFLTGKYRIGGPWVDGPRADRVRSHLNGNGPTVLAALDLIASAHRTTVAVVALAWLAAQPTVATPLAGARNPAQLAGRARLGCHCGFFEPGGGHMVGSPALRWDDPGLAADYSMKSRTLLDLRQPMPSRTG